MKRLLILLLAVTACSGPAPQLSTQSPTKSGPTLTATPTPSPTTTASTKPKPTPMPDLNWRAPGRAPDFLIVNNGGRVEVRDSRGRFKRVLVERTETGRVPLFLSLDLSPDRRILYFVRYISESCTEIVKVPVAGGRPSVVAQASSVDVSPDGKHLAYALGWMCGTRRSYVVVRDLSTGAERRWTDRDAFGGSIAWLPDSRYLIFERCGADSCGPRVIDTASMTMTSRRPYNLPSSIDYMNAFVSLPVLRGDLGAAALLVNYSSEDGTEPHPVLQYNFDTRQTKNLFARGKNIRSVAFDRTGYHLLYVTADRRLFRYDGERVVALGTGITGAVW